MEQQFLEEITKGYTFKSDFILLGGAVLDGKIVEGAQIKAPLKMFNRHGLIAGATGTGKTKTLQKLAESLSEKGVSVLMMDMKGDVSGISKAGEENPKLIERSNSLSYQWKAKGFPVEFLNITEGNGVRLRATVTEFGPVLFSKILELNDTQSGVIALVFKYCDDHKIPLIDLKDFKKTLQYLTNEGKAEIEKEYGRISTASTSTIIRKIIEIETQGAEKFFGELSFDVEDLCRIDDNGNGYINILRLTDLQDKPKLFSTFMLQLLAEIYATFPEEGDMDQPKLVVFIDEAHLIFNEASKALLQQLESIIKLIRSKGIGIFFCTQLPTDIPANILGQLGMKIQHALRAFTAQDRKAIKLTAENYPETNFYKTEDILTSLGIGEALVTTLNEKGNPTPLAHCMLLPPSSRMDTISDEELNELIEKSKLVKKYFNRIEGESAYEILNDKIEGKIEEQEKVSAAAQQQTSDAKQSNTRAEKSVIEQAAANPLVRTIAKELTRGLLGALGLGTTRRTTRKGSWF
jgi:uncharacterized protein